MAAAFAPSWGVPPAHCRPGALPAAPSRSAGLARCRAAACRPLRLTRAALQMSAAVGQPSAATEGEDGRPAADGPAWDVDLDAASAEDRLTDALADVEEEWGAGFDGDDDSDGVQELVVDVDGEDFSPLPPQQRKKAGSGKRNTQLKEWKEAMTTNNRRGADSTAPGGTAGCYVVEPIDEDEITPFARTAVLAADERKAVEPVAIRIAALTCMASYVVVSAGRNPPQMRAIANMVQERLAKEHSLKPRHVSGTPDSGWILLDYGDLLVNVFSVESRRHYDFDNFWAAGERLDLSADLPSGGAGAAVGAGAAGGGTSAAAASDKGDGGATPLDDWLD